MNQYGSHSKSYYTSKAGCGETQYPKEMEAKCVPTGYKLTCAPKEEEKHQEAKSAGYGAGWLSIFGLWILFFILFLIVLWIVDFECLRKYDGDDYCEDRDIVKYVFVSIILAIIFSLVTVGSGAYATAGCAWMSSY